MDLNISSKIETLIRARYPLIVIETYEEDRAQKIIEKIANQRNKKLYCWTITRGIYEHNISIQSKRGIDTSTTDPLIALDNILNITDSAIFILKDFHPFLSDAVIVRKLRDLASYFRILLS